MPSEADEAALTRAQSTIARLLNVTRGGPCVQSRPVFISRYGGQHNIGDEMNVDVAGALLDLPQKAEFRWPSYRPALKIATSGVVRPKLLLIGSVLANAQPGDVVAGAGFKLSAANIARLPLLRNGSVRVAMVRGPRTCGALADVWEPIAHAGNPMPWPKRTECGLISSDPALIAHLLVPEWRDLRRSALPWAEAIALHKVEIHASHIAHPPLLILCTHLLIGCMHRVCCR